MQTALFSSATLAEFYRFALLLTGGIKMAEQIMAETIHEAEAQLAELRGETNRHAWLAMRIRQRCLRENAINENAIPRLLRSETDDGEKPEILQIEAFIVAQRFSTLPEPERTALALFYLELFQPEEIARLLKMSLEDLGGTLSRARAFLAASMEGQET